MKKYILIAASIISIILWAYGCSFNAYISPGNIEQDKKIATSEIKLFHDRFNGGKYAEIYENASEYMWKVQSKETIISGFELVGKELGNFTRVQDSRLNVIVGTPVQVRVVYVSEFQSGSVTEIFNFVKEGSKVKLASYRVSKGAVNLNEVDSK